MTAQASYAEVDADDRLHLRLDGGAPRPGSLLFTRREEPQVAVRTPVRAAGDELIVELSAQMFMAGHWGISLDDDTGTPIQLTEPGFSLDGLLAYARRPRPLVMWSYRTQVSGQLALRVRDGGAHAEVRSMHVRNGRVRLGGVVAFTALETGDIRRPGTLRIRRRTDGATVTEPADVRGVAFEAGFDLTAIAELPLALPHSAETPVESWDVWLGVAGIAGELRCGAYLDDIVSKKRAFRYPKGTGEVDGRVIEIWAHYGADLNVVVERKVVDPVA